jgi:hypothetical protein
MRLALTTFWIGVVLMVVAWGGLVWIGGTPRLDRTDGYKVGFTPHQNHTVSREMWIGSWVAISGFVGGAGLLAIGGLLHSRATAEQSERESAVIELPQKKS